MVLTTLERYDSESGESAEILREPGGSIRAEVTGTRFESLLRDTFDTIESAREAALAALPKPYTKTI